MVCAHWVIGGEFNERTACRVDKILGHAKGHPWVPLLVLKLKGQEKRSYLNLGREEMAACWVSDTGSHVEPCREEAEGTSTPALLCWEESWAVACPGCPIV